MAKKTGPETTDNLAEPKSVPIMASKFFQLYRSGVHIYQRAYLVERYRGIMKTRDEWEKILEKDLEGDK